MSLVKQNSQPHLRKIIRRIVLEGLRRNVDVGERVYSSRPNPAWLKECPLCLVYYESELADDNTTTPRYYEKNLQLSIQIISDFQKDVEDYLDSRAYEIEATMEDLYEFITRQNNDEVFGKDYGDCGLAFIHDIVLLNSVPITLEYDGDHLYESTKLIYNIKYETKHLPDQSDVTEFLRMWVDYNIDNQISQDNVNIRG